MALRMDRESVSLKYLLVAGLMAWCLICPPFSYLMAPRYLAGHRRDWVTRVEYDHESYGVI